MFIRLGVTIHRTAAVFAIIGGALMVASGPGTRGFLLTALGLAGAEIPNYLGRPCPSLAVTVLSLLIALGGITVILGGLSIFAGHGTSGRLFILLG